jgi:hypothetical protein
MFSFMFEAVLARKGNQQRKKWGRNKEEEEEDSLLKETNSFLL